MRGKIFTLSLGIVLGLHTLISLPGVSAHRPRRVTEAADAAATPAILRAENTIIGTVESAGTLFVEGRTVTGKESLRGGELIEASRLAPARVSLTGVGEITVSPGAQTRLASAQLQSGAAGNQSLLTAQIVQGTVAVRLQREAGALVQIGATAFTALGGSSFRAEVTDHRIKIETESGAVWTPDKWAVRLPEKLSANKAAVAQPVHILPALPVNSRPRIATEPSPNLNAVTANVAAPAAESLATRRAAFLRSIRLMTPGYAASSSPQPAINNSLRATEFNALPAALGLAESVDALTINGRQVSHKEAILGGELIQAPARTGMHVSLEQFGKVMLSARSQARFSAALTGESADAKRQILIAALSEGEMSLRLLPHSYALVLAGGLALTAFNGVNARVSLREGRVIVETSEAGLAAWPMPLQPDILNVAQQNAQAAGQVQRRLFVRPVGLQSNIVVRARSTRQIQVQVTDENDQPVPDLPILFALGGGRGIGTFQTQATSKALTNARGVASVNFDAKDLTGTENITATVEGTNFSWAGTITVIRAVPGFWAPQNSIPFFTVIAVPAVVGPIVFQRNNEERSSIRPAGSPVIRP